MTLESIEKLLSDDASLAILEKRLLSCTGRNFIGDALNAIAEEIEAEIAERFIELPVDEDGITIYVGDMVQGLGDSGPVQHLELWDGGWVVVFELAPGQLTRYSGDAVHHVKPRTVEDVLRDFVNEAEWEQSPDSYEEIERRLITLYAAEIRDLMGMDR